MKKMIFVLVVMAFCSTCFAGLILQDQTGNHGQIGGSFLKGQSFTAEDPQIQTIGFYIVDMNAGHAPDDNEVVVNLYSGVGNGGTLIATSSNAAIPDSNHGWVYFDFSSATLNVGSVYSAMLGDEVRWGVSVNQHNIAGNEYIGGDAIFNGTVSPIQDLAFSVTPTPEPATIALFAIGGLALRRKRKA
jgi:hypothetical protein